MSETRLKFKGLSGLGGVDGSVLLLFTDEAERLQVSLLGDAWCAKQFERRFKGARHDCTFITEALALVLQRHPEVCVELHIEGLTDNQYDVFLVEEETALRVRVSAGDAALLSCVGDIPLYINNDLLRTQSTPYKDGSPSVLIPINIMSDEMLRKAFDEAVKTESYETASYLKKELQRRNKAAME